MYFADIIRPGFSSEFLVSFPPIVHTFLHKSPISIFILTIFIKRKILGPVHFWLIFLNFFFHSLFNPFFHHLNYFHWSFNPIILSVLLVFPPSFKIPSPCCFCIVSQALNYFKKKDSNNLYSFISPTLREMYTLKLLKVLQKIIKHCRNSL